MNATAATFSFKQIAIDFKEITKAGLAISVVFSSIAGYLLGVLDFHDLKVTTLLMLAIGGYCMVGASNAFNQVIEKDLDALMDRTKNRHHRGAVGIGGAMRDAVVHRVGGVGSAAESESLLLMVE